MWQPGARKDKIETMVDRIDQKWTSETAPDRDGLIWVSVVYL
jgi:hypothetical protein